MAQELDEFTASYIETALWSSYDYENDDTPLDENFGPGDINPDTLAKIVADCRAFQEDHGHLFEGREGRAGHDFWLTRNRHGAGFWDGDWPKDVGKELTDSAHIWGSVDLYVGDDGQIHSN